MIGIIYVSASILVEISAFTCLCCVLKRLHTNSYAALPFNTCPFFSIDSISCAFLGPKRFPYIHFYRKTCNYAKRWGKKMSQYFNRYVYVYLWNGCYRVMHLLHAGAAYVAWLYHAPDVARGWKEMLPLQTIIPHLTYIWITQSQFVRVRQNMQSC